MNNTNEVFAECEVVIGKLATRYQQHFGDREAAIAEAYVILAEGLPQYDPTMPIEKWAGYRVGNRFRQLATQAKERREDICRIDYSASADGSIRDFNVLEFLDELSEDARFLANLVLDPPEDFAEYCHNGKFTLRDIRSFMGYWWNWKRNRITAAIREIREALK